jgi:hypothetical protein
MKELEAYLRQQGNPDAIILADQLKAHREKNGDITRQDLYGESAFFDFVEEFEDDEPEEEFLRPRTRGGRRRELEPLTSSNLTLVEFDAEPLTQMPEPLKELLAQGYVLKSAITQKGEVLIIDGVPLDDYLKHHPQTVLIPGQTYFQRLETPWRHFDVSQPQYVVTDGWVHELRENEYRNPVFELAEATTSYMLLFYRTAQAGTESQSANIKKRQKRTI